VFAKNGKQKQGAAMKLILEKWRKYEEEQRLDEVAEMGDEYGSRSDSEPGPRVSDALRRFTSPESAGGQLGNIAGGKAASRSVPSQVAGFAGDILNTYQQSGEHDTAGHDPAGSARTAIESGVIERIPKLGHVGLATDIGNTIQHLTQGRGAEAGRTAMAGAGDALGGILGTALLGPGVGTAIGATAGDWAGRSLGPGSVAHRRWSDPGRLMSDFGYEVGALAPGGETAMQRYGDRGVGQTLDDFGYEVGDVVDRRVIQPAAEAAESFRSGEMFGPRGTAIANSPWNPLSRNFALYEGESMATHQKTDLLTEAQVLRMRQLSGISSKRRVVLNEEVATGMWAVGLIVYFLVLGEMTDRWQVGKPEGGPLSALGRGVKSAWQKLKSSAESKAQQGDESLESVVDAVESEGARAAQSANLSEEDIARIQSEFGDDEQLAALLSQLEEAPPEAYEQVLMQIEQYVKSKL
tara:strand:- start:772 stop:2169 length:1398 start_codon:yes stop_codon:yes gene_type:complete